MKNILITMIAMSLLLFSLSSWPASTKEEIKALSAQIEAMQKDLAEIKTLIKAGTRIQPKKPAAPAFKEQVVSIGNSPYLGDVDATVTMIEYSDYQCPFCARNYRDVMPTLVREYVDTGKLKIIMRENPLENIHRNATNASMAALCAHDQGKYWEMHNLMFDNQRELAVNNLKGFADTIGLNTTTFDECLDSNKYKQQIADDMLSGAKLGVTGTPAFVLGLTDKDDSGKATMSRFLKGAKGLAYFKADIDKLLGSAE